MDAQEVYRQIIEAIQAAEAENYVDGEGVTEFEFGYRSGLARAADIVQVLAHGQKVR